MMPNTNPYNVSFDATDEVKITTSIHVTKELTYDCRKFYAWDPFTTTICMSHDDDEPWFDAFREFNSRHDTPEAIDNYKEWDQPSNILKDIGIINECMTKHIEPDYYISKHHSFEN